LKTFYSKKFTKNQDIKDLGFTEVFWYNETMPKPQLKIYPSQKNFTRLFDKEKRLIKKQIGNLPIEHIGSTSIPGLGGKGIIDITIGLKTWSLAPKIVKKLKAIGFNHIHPKENERIFLSTKAQTGLGDFHIHLVLAGGKQFKDFLIFRDYLKNNKIELDRYSRLKKQALKISHGNRLKYAKLKNNFIQNTLTAAKKPKMVLATYNPGKLKEVREILKKFNIVLLSLNDVGFKKEIKENGKTFTENAFKKAKTVAKKTGLWTIADDSGICIEALNNRPGVKSGRWAGLGANDGKIVAHTLNQLKNVPIKNRQAVFETALALVSPNNRFWIFKGQVFGTVSLKPKGKPRKKLAYDVIFIPKGYTKTFAEMPDWKKNKLSHRGLALAKLKKFLEKNYDRFV